MPNGPGSTKASCVTCREAVEIPDRYAHGDHIRCGACDTDHRIVRGDRVRLVIGDVSPLREALAQNQRLVSRLQDDLARARGSFGVGVNGFGIGVLFAVYRVVGGAPIDKSLIASAILLAIVSGLLLEGANWAFLAKRGKIDALSREIGEAQAEGTRLRAQIRDASRV